MTDVNPAPAGAGGPPQKAVSDSTGTIDSSSKSRLDLAAGTRSSLSEYKRLGKLGEGTFSEVVQARHRASGQIVALKRFKKQFGSIHEVESLREIQALRRLMPHPNIIELLDVIFDPRSGVLCLAMELMDCNLYDLLSNKTLVISETKARVYMYQVLKAMDYMHTNGIFHRDIKPENILVTKDVVKLADFGSCRSIHSKPPFTEYIATRWYRSPECLLCDGRYNFKMDIWGVGCVLYEVLTKLPLFPGSDEVDQLNRIHGVLGSPTQAQLRKIVGPHLNGASLVFPHKSGSGLRSLMPTATMDCIAVLDQLLAYDPDERISARQAMQQQWFRGVHVDAAPAAKLPEPVRATVDVIRDPLPLVKAVVPVELQPIPAPQPTPNLAAAAAAAAAASAAAANSQVLALAKAPEPSAPAAALPVISAQKPPRNNQSNRWSMPAQTSFARVGQTLLPSDASKPNVPSEKPAPQLPLLLQQNPVPKPSQRASGRWSTTLASQLLVSPTEGTGEGLAGQRGPILPRVAPVHSTGINGAAVAPKGTRQNRAQQPSLPLAATLSPSAPRQWGQPPVAHESSRRRDAYLWAKSAQRSPKHVSKPWGASPHMTFHDAHLAKLAATRQAQVQASSPRAPQPANLAGTSVTVSRRQGAGNGRNSQIPPMRDSPVDADNQPLYMALNGKVALRAAPSAAPSASATRRLSVYEMVEQMQRLPAGLAPLPGPMMSLKQPPTSTALPRVNKLS